MDNTNDEYRNAWAEGEAAAAEPTKAAPIDDEPVAPAVNAVKAAYESDRDAQAKEFSDAFNKLPPAPGEEAPVEPKPATFKQAFAAARAKALANPEDKSLKVFEFNGKKFTTELKATKAPVAKAADPVAEPAAAPAENPNKHSIYDGSIVDTIVPDTKAAVSRNQGRATKPVVDPKGKPAKSYTGMGA